MMTEDLSRYLWEGLDLQRYSVVRIVPQDKDNQLVTTQQIEQYAMSVARWIQCEEAVSEFGFLAKKPTGTVFSSPYVTMGQEYMKQANAAWYQIYQVVKENCIVDLGGKSLHDDVMERLLRARMGQKHY